MRRYEHPSPGDLLHLDIKKLGRFQRAGHRVTSDKSQRCRGAGWEFMHVAIDDHTRIAFSQILSDERGHSAVAFLQAAVGYYRSLGIRIRRLLTDNGSCYRSRLFSDACRRLAIRHRFTRPYTPRTNGKAERFIQTALREWAYARSYCSSEQRAVHLMPLASRLQLASPSRRHPLPSALLPAPHSHEQRVDTPQLADPWEVEWGPDRWLWITERSAGRVTRVHPKTGEQKVAAVIGEVRAPGGQDGLLGLTLHPDLLQGKGRDYVYIAYTYEDREKGLDPMPPSPRRLTTTSI